MRSTLILSLKIILLWSCQQQPKDVADTIYTNGKIYTVNEEEPWAEAMALKDGKFLKVGSADQIQTFSGDETQTVDLKGKVVLPGFIDSHNHALNGADDEANLFIRNPETVESILAELKTYAEANPDLEVIRGGPWNLGVFPEDNPPKELLDEIVPDRPVYLISQSGHSAWINSKCMELVGLRKDTPITATFIYSKDPVTGEPTGRIDEYAMGAVEKVIPLTSPERLEPGIRKIQTMHNSYGVTTIKLAEGRENWAKGAVALDNKGGLTMRLMVSWDWGSHYSPHDAQQAEEFASRWQEYSSEMVDARSIKIFYDGAMDSYTAKMLEDYEGRPGFKGKSHKSKEAFQEAIERINGNGIGVIIHVMGDASAREVVDIFEGVRAKNGDNGAILHLSHAVQAKPEDLVRLATINGTAVDFSPALAVQVPQLEVLFKNPIGRVRYQKQFNVKAAVDAEANVGFGSDWPSSLIPEPNTFWYLDTWVNRKLPGDPDAIPHNPEQAITLEQAIKAYTLGSAQTMGFDWAEKVGSIEEGKYADFIVLDRNIFDIPTTDLYLTQVDYTYVGGRLVFDRTAEENKLNLKQFEIVNEELNNAIDAAELNLLIADEDFSGGCGHDVDLAISPGARMASATVNVAFSSLGDQGYRFLKPARTVFWEQTQSNYWIQWAIRNEEKSLWAFDPELKQVVEVLRIVD